VYRRAETFPRTMRSSETDLTNGVAFFTFLRPMVDLKSIQIYVKGGTAAKSGATLIREALYRLEYLPASSAIGIKKIAETASTTSLFATAEACVPVAYSTAGGYPANYILRAGVIYAVGIIAIGQTTAAKVRGIIGVADGLGPDIAWQLFGQTDLPAETTMAALTESNFAIWFGVSR
jgi:hypothetical protein